MEPTAALKLIELEWKNMDKEERAKYGEKSAEPHLTEKP